MTSRGDTLSTAPVGPRECDGPDRRLLVGVLVAAALFVTGFTWSKWWPYVVKIDGLAATREWDGGALLDVARDAPNWWTGAWEFTLAYTDSVWKALVVGLLIAAAIDALLPRQWLLRVLTGRNATGGAAIAGAASMPSMMCTCCASPVAVSMSRSGVPISSVVAYWLGNPVLNPAVLVFLALVGPWEWVATRLVVGIVLVLGAAVLAARLVPGRRADPAVVAVSGAEGEDREDATPSLGGFLRSLGRFSITLVPEYLGLVFLVGAAAHLLSWDAGWVTGGGLGLVALAAVALLMVIPTGGEIPVLIALASADASPWVLGLVLIALPAVSLPSLLMVGRALTWRVTGATAAAVVGSGALAGALLAVVA